MITKKSFVITLTALIVIAFLVATSSAQDTLLISYQGRLTDEGGTPVTGTPTMIFTIYDGSGLGATSKWSETHPSVPVTDGLFNVILGSVTALPDSVFNGDNRYLGIAVDGDPEIEPRVLLASVPGAAFAKKMVGEVVTEPGALMLRSSQGVDSAIVLQANESASELKIGYAVPLDDQRPGLDMGADESSNFFRVNWMLASDQYEPGFEVSSDINEGVKMRLGVPPNDINPTFQVEADAVSEQVKMVLGEPPGDQKPSLELISSPTSGAGINIYDEIGQVMGLEPTPYNSGFSIKLMDPGDDGNLFELTGNHITNEVNMKLIDPVDEKTLLTISSAQTGASFRMATPLPEPPIPLLELKVEEVSGPASDWASYFNMYSMNPGDDGRETFEISNTLTDGISLKMFNPQPEPPAKYLEMGVDPASGPSLGFFDDIGQVMGFDPSPFNSGFSLRLMDPGDDGALAEITSSYGTKGGSGEVAVYDTDNSLESHLTPAKLVLTHSPGMAVYPPIFLDATSIDDPRIGIGTDTPSEPLVIGADLGHYSGNMITIGNANSASFAGLTMGRDINNRYYMVWNNVGNYLYAGTRSGGTFYSNTLVLRDGQVGIGTNIPSEELHVVGDICYTGSIGACSDRRYKKNITSITGALDKVNRLHGVRFNWRRDEFPGNRFSDKDQIGLIAQELKEVLPQVVSEDDNGYYNVDYGRLAPVLVEAIKEQQGQINRQQQQIEKLMKRIEVLEESQFTNR